MCEFYLKKSSGKHILSQRCKVTKFFSPRQTKRQKYMKNFSPSKHTHHFLLRLMFLERLQNTKSEVSAGVLHSSLTKTSPKFIIINLYASPNY